MTDHTDLRRLAMAATPGPYNVYAETVTTKDDAIAECAYQVHHTDPFVGKVYMLNASGKCPAVTGCGPTSEANARFFAAADPQTVIGLLDRMEALAAENAELKQNVIAFAAPHAASYARDFGLPDGHLHPQHYDLLEKCGARMVAFTRSALSGKEGQ